MITGYILGGLTLISVGLNVWQWLAARRFPLHQPIAPGTGLPTVTVLKPLKGCDEYTAECLRSWLAQDYPAAVQVLFGVGDANDPAVAVVRGLIREFPQLDARLVICPESPGPNPKVATLMQLEPLISSDALVISDADVKVPPGILTEAMTVLQRNGVGLVNSFYRLADPQNRAMWIEAMAANCDFWSQVCQSNSMRPMQFALGAVMGLRTETLRAIGGFKALVDYLADDNRLGLLVHRTGQRVELTNVVVDCHSGPMTFRQVWDHQLRWARTIRVCEPVPYFFSVLTHSSVWATLLLTWSLLATGPRPVFWALGISVVTLFVRGATASANWHRLTGVALPLRRERLLFDKDWLAAVWWLFAFLGNTIVWRGRRHHLGKEGRLVPREGKGRTHSPDSSRTAGTG